MTRMTIDLATILEHRYPNGFHAPADIPLDTFLEFADDDWEHSIDVFALLEEQRVAAITFGTAEVLERRPDLTGDQAWEVATIARDDFIRDRCHLDFLECTADALFPSVKRKALDRVYSLRFRLRERLGNSEAAPPDVRESGDRLQQWMHELGGIERIARKLPDQVTTDPAAYSSISAALDDLENAINNKGEIA
ncbi:MAG: hypothetical protein ACRC8S_21535 [Fimbriiglobus sp.]